MSLLLRTITVTTAALCTLTTTADDVLQIYCEDCRGTEHSRDFGNFAFNQTYGVDSWVLQDELIIVNPEGNWVHVDLAFVLQENIISNLGDMIGLDLGIPTGEIQLDTTTDTTETDSYTVDLDMIDTMGPLPVGEDNDLPPGTFSAGSGGDTSGSGGVGAGTGSGSGGAGSGSGSGNGTACTSADNGDWYCVPY